MLAFKKHKKSYIILLVNLLLVAIGIILYNKTEQVLKTDQEERLIAKINLHIDSVLISLKDAQRGERGFVISGDKTHLQAFYNAKKRLNGLVGDLELSLKDQKDIQKRFIASERLIENALAKFDEIIKIREEEGPLLAVLAKRDYEGKLFIDTLQNTIQSIEKYEKEKLDNDEQKAIASLEEIVTLLALSGVVIFVIVILLSTSLVRDILKREELNLKLEGSEKRYNFLFELSADGIIVADLDGIITDCNTAACKIFGFSKKELMGKSYHIFWPDEQKHLLPAKISRKTVTGDRPIERTYVKKDGSTLNAEVYTKLIEINGLSNVVAHIRDITEKKQTQKAIAKSEKKYRNLFERSLAGIFRTTVNGEIIECNDEYARVLGYDSADDIKNISTKNIYADPTDREKLVALLRNEGEVKDLIMKLRKKNGSYAWVYDSVSMMYDEDLKKEVLFGTLVDITAQKEAELLLAASEKKYKDLAELLPQTVFEFDLNAKVTFANKAGFDAFGYTPEDFEKGLNVFQLIIPEDRERAKGNVEAAVSGIKQSNNEYTAVRKNGTTFPILIYSSPLIRNNKPEGIRGIVVDISELKQAEKVLKENEASLKEAQRIGKMGNWEYDLVKQKTIWSDGCYLLYGLKPYELEPTNEYFRSRIHPDDLHLIDEGHEKLLKQKMPVDFGMRIVFPNGDIKWVQNKIIPIFEDNKLVTMKGVNIDITESKHAEEEILQLNRIYSVLSNINQTIVRIKDKQQLLIAACKIAIDDGKFKMSWIGLVDEETGELKAAASHGFIDGYLDEVIFDIKNYPPGVKPVSEVIDTCKPSIFNNIEVLDEDTFWRQAALNRGYKSNAAFPLKIFGKAIGSFSLFSDQVGFFEEKEIRLLAEMSEDISFALETMEIEKKRKKSESLFLTLANISPVGIFRTRADGYTTYVNRKWCQLSGLKAEEALGDGWLKAVHPEDQIWLAKGWKSATDKKQSSVTEYRFIRSDGKTAWVMGQAIPELNSEGQIEGYVGTITDITSIKSYERELVEAKEVAEKSDRMKSEFLAQMSHEIRTPINVIVSNTGFLKDELEGRIDQELFSTFYSLDAAGKRIIRTVDLILNMTEIQTNSYHFTPVELNLSGKFLINIYNEFISAAKEKNLEFNLHRKTTDANIYADEYSVRQIFFHLIDNAIKYTHEGSVDLTVDKDAEGKILVSIADTGIGISNEFMTTMYEPFTQEEQGYSRSFEGNGLGLALVKKYCDLNNATITVESIKGKGSVFTVKF